MPRRPSNPKREEFKEAASGVVSEATREGPEEPTDKPGAWTTPTGEETAPPKIP